MICWVGLALFVLWWVLSAKSLLTGSNGPQVDNLVSVLFLIGGVSP
jgi:hypothetical protein